MSIRRRLMMQVGKSDPYDAMGYVKKGKIFHLDGINKGGSSTSWIDLVGGVEFPLATGITFAEDHVSFASNHGLMKATTSINVPKYTGTIEAVFTYPTSRQSIFYTGHDNTISLMMSENNTFLMPISQGVAPKLTIPKSARVAGKVSQYSLFAGSGKCNGVTMETSSGSYFSLGNRYAIIGTFRDAASYKFVGDLYCIRAYNRHLTYEERAHNLEVDNERFNLGLNL